jgi:hypothetical protein
MKALLRVARAAISDPGHRKNTHPRSPSRAFYTRMNKNGRSSRHRHIMDYARAAMSQTELYCEAHPGSPSAVRRPRLFVRGELWIALLGPTVEEGDCRDWGNCYSSLAGIRRPISGGAAAARRDNRPHTTTERVLYLESWSASHRNKSVTTGVTSWREPRVTRKGITRRENR